MFRLSTLLLHCLELQTEVAAVEEAEQQQHWRARILVGQNQVRLLVVTSLFTL